MFFLGEGGQDAAHQGVEKKVWRGQAEDCQNEGGTKVQTFLKYVFVFYALLNLSKF